VFITGTFNGAGTGLTGTANSLNAGIGVNQSWQNVFGSRALATTYTNSTGKPIMVTVSFQLTDQQSYGSFFIDGVKVAESGKNLANTDRYSFSLIIPNSSTYSISATTGSITLITWFELR
jgi:hypothetical protein